MGPQSIQAWEDPRHIGQKQNIDVTNQSIALEAKQLHSAKKAVGSSRGSQGNGQEFGAVGRN